MQSILKSHEEIRLYHKNIIIINKLVSKTIDSLKECVAEKEKEIVSLNESYDDVVRTYENILIALMADSEPEPEPVPEEQKSVPVESIKNP